ncbi:MAG TPA: ornithine carbamoyltransferase [Bryobacteraceae bacterium]|nr:ornithine carbamoyltransferase [Bryobacteraceae bacterium]HOQ47169.1 ornithine carbamoyltransferase [Bryobacteraceae bacterium]HPQ15205.1 ornithine carbamoyltransferase [Bryobacteraceae bacterium]HPU72536.1 ornithine carbamoyltransferase [Bryobacteraceae bacterium]
MQAGAPADPILKMSGQDLTCDLDLSHDEVNYLLDLADAVKAAPRRFASALAGRTLSLLFEKPSLRTRLTFELAIKQLGGDSVFSSGMIGEREPIKDVARNLERWTNCIVARTFSQETVMELARWSKIPVINALSDLYHPCQALADVMTLRERFGSLRGLKVAFVGDGNNVAHSLMLSAARLGADVVVASPPGYAPNPDVVGQAQGLAAAAGSTVTITTVPEEAVTGANAVYTDVWTSMGSENEAERRRKAFCGYQVDEKLFSLAAPGAVFMHCLPAHRGEEVTDAVIESQQSVVFDQAENRLHAQKALLLMMID